MDRAWKELYDENSSVSPLQFCLIALAAGLSSLAVTLTKSIFEMVIPLFILPFLIYGFKNCLHKKTAPPIRLFLFLFIFTSAYFVPLNAYKGANQKYNGHFVLTSRGAAALYGNIERRMEKHSSREILTALAWIPTEEFCVALFGEEECSFWKAQSSDERGSRKSNELLKENLTDTAVEKMLIQISLKKILANPLQDFGFRIIEFLKLMFWESTHVGFVAYPDWIEKIYFLAVLKYGLSTLTAILSVLAIFHTISFLRKTRNSSGAQPPTLLFFIALTTISYLALLTFFSTVPRFGYPLIPLIILQIAFFLQKLFERRLP